MGVTAAIASPALVASFITCANLLISGISYDGGYADYMIVPAQALALVPKERMLGRCFAPASRLTTPFEIAARAPATWWRSSEGGLGHLGVRFAAKIGFRTVAIARGQDKEALARKLGASHYIDNQMRDPAAELARMGGAKAILATVTSGDAMRSVLGGLAINGTMLVIGAVPSLEVNPLFLLGGCRSVKGWYSGTSIDSQDTLRFSVLTGVRSMNEVLPLERASEAYERMMSGKARFRVVLTTGN